MNYYSFKSNPFTSKLYRLVWDSLHPETRFIFFATTGRSGTGSLQRVFAKARGCVALHEPYPTMHSDILISKCLGDDSEARRTYWTRKAVHVRRAATGHMLYVETSHVFIESFSEYAIKDFGSRLRVVHLQRDPVFVARSMASLSEVPGTPGGDHWYLNFASGTNVISGVTRELQDGGLFSHPFYRCLWYWYEIEARIALMKEHHPGLDVCSLSWTTQLYPGEVSKVLEWAGVSVGLDLLSELLSEPTNTKEKSKKRWDVDIEELRTMHSEFRDYLEGLGHSLCVFGGEDGEAENGRDKVEK